MSDKTHEERISNLEVAVRRIETRVMEGRPTPPGVFPPMTGFCAVACTCGWQGVGESRLLAHVREAHGLEAASLREVERIAPPPAEVNLGQPSPAEAAIFERGGYVAPRLVCHHCQGPIGAEAFRGPDGVVCAACMPPTPAAMLGEAVKMAHRAESLAFDAYHSMWTAGAPDGIASARVLLVEAVSALKRAQREAETRLANCPRGIHDGPGADACDCAAIAKAEQADGAGDRIESRFCNQDGHRWSHGRCAFCGADRAMEERRGGPAVDEVRED